MDDDTPTRTAIRRTLEGYRYSVIEASNGNEALEKMDPTIDLVITDLVMPDMDGLELLRILKRRSPKLPVIAISGEFNGQFLSVAKLLGASQTLEKPFHPAALLKVVDCLLMPQQMRAAL